MYSQGRVLSVFTRDATPKQVTLLLGVSRGGLEERWRSRCDVAICSDTTRTLYLRWTPARERVDHDTAASLRLALAFLSEAPRYILGLREQYPQCF